jgi:enoyl-CoA hydratase/carnithine racemase
MEINLTGRDVPAPEALRTGLVEQVAEPGHFEADVRNMTRRIAATGPLGNRAVKKLVRATLRMDLKTARACDALRGTIRGTADSAEGIAAYRENHPPRFQGK